MPFSWNAAARPPDDAGAEVNEVGGVVDDDGGGGPGAIGQGEPECRFREARPGLAGIHPGLLRDCCAERDWDRDHEEECSRWDACYPHTCFPLINDDGSLREEEALLAKSGVAVGLQVGDDLRGGKVGGS